MKKFLLLFTSVLLIPLSSAVTQTLMDYVSEVKGDTLVIKDYYDMSNQPNSLYYALLLDTVDVPAGRVYELKINGYYPHTIQPVSSANHHTVIVGSDPTPLVNNKNVNSSPPLICVQYAEWVERPGGIAAKGDLTIKNCELSTADIHGGIGWVFSAAGDTNLHLLFENCLFEHAWWVFVLAIYENCDITFRNCYFVNMDGYPFNHSGGVFDSFYDQDTLLVENCTHIMAQGSLYWLRNYSFKRIIINHNTFINCAGPVFMNPGYQSNISLTNNIFVNCNIQPFHPSYYTNFALLTGTIPVPDPDGRPMGLVNVNPYSLNGADSTRKLLVEANAAYWDQSLDDIVSIVNTNRVNEADNWQSQMIRMNDRTEAMFDDDFNYPYLTEGFWYEQMPDFTDSKDLFTSQLTNLKVFALASVDTLSHVSLPMWRLINTGQNMFVNADWPIPVDLSYDDPDLLTAGMGGFPLGDLNWFPDRKVEWLTQRTAELDSIHNALNSGRLVNAVDDYDTQPVEFQLWQNYPNPFNPSTIIRFSIPKAGYVTLKVYNILGQEVAVLLDGNKNPQTYNIKFDGAGLPSGVYLYSLTASGMNQVKKMVLAK